MCGFDRFRSLLIQSRRAPAAVGKGSRDPQADEGKGAWLGNGGKAHAVQEQLGGAAADDAGLGTECDVVGARSNGGAREIEGEVRIRGLGEAEGNRDGGDETP